MTMIEPTSGPILPATEATASGVLAFVQSLNSEIEPEQIMQRTVAAIAEAIGASQGGLAYVHDGCLTAQRYWTEGVWHERSVRLPLAASASGRTATTGEPYISNNVAEDSLITEAAKRERTASTLLSLPLKGRDGATIAVLNLHDKRDRAPFDEHDIQIAAAYLPHAAAAIERARLFEAVRRHEQELDFLANHDALTGLANRRSFLQALTAAVAGRRDCEWGCLALFDLDGLKDLNETFGLQAGDQAIACAARALQRATPPDALAARIGGDEFAVIAGSVDPAAFKSLQSRLRRLAGRLGVITTADGRRVQLRGAVGVARLDSGDSADLLAEAEQALYRQKHTILKPHRPADSAPADGEPEDGKAVYHPRGRRAVAEELAAILRAAESLSAAGSQQTLLERLTAETARIADAEIASVGLLQEDGSLVFNHIWQQGAISRASVIIPPEEFDNSLGDVIGKSDIYRTERANSRSPLKQRLIERYGFRSLLMTPVVGRDGKAVGMVAIANKRGGRPFTEHDATLSRAFAALAAGVAENLHLYDEAQEQSRQAEEARQYYWALMEQASEAVLVMDVTSMTIIDVNQRAVELYGYTRDEFIGFEQGWDIRSEAERRRGEGLTHLAARDGAGRLTRTREHAHKDGHTFLVDVSAGRIATPHGPVVVAFVRAK